MFVNDQCSLSSLNRLVNVLSSLSISISLSIDTSQDYLFIVEKIIIIIIFFNVN